MLNRRLATADFCALGHQPNVRFHSDPSPRGGLCGSVEFGFWRGGGPAKL